MQMFRKDLENILKEKYAAQQSDIDHDALWSRVYPEIKKDKKRPLIFWLFGSGVLFVAVLMWMVLGTSTVNITNEQNTARVTNVQVHKSENSLALNKVEETISQDETIEENRIETTISKQTKDEIIGNNRVTPTTYESNLKNRMDDSVVSLDYSNSTSRIIPQVFETITMAENSEDSELICDTNGSSSNIRAYYASLNNLIGLEFLLDFKRAELSLELEPSVEDLPFEKKTFGKFTSMDLTIGYGLAFSNLSSSEADFYDLLVKRKDAEQSLDVWSGDLLFNYQLSNHWNMRSGLDYQMITDKTIHQFVNSEVIMGDSVLISTLEDSEGFVSNVYGQGEELLQTSSIKTRYNYYHSLGLPLELVYSNKIGSVQYELGGGIRISKLFSSAGHIQETENTEYDLSTDVNHFFGRSINTELLLNAGLVYSLSDQLGWKSGLQFKYGLDGLNTDLNPISQKYNLIKITTGLRYQF